MLKPAARPGTMSRMSPERLAAARVPARSSASRLLDLLLARSDRRSGVRARLRRQTAGEPRGAPGRARKGLHDQSALRLHRPRFVRRSRQGERAWSREMLREAEAGADGVARRGPASSLDAPRERISDDDGACHRPTRCRCRSRPRICSCAATMRAAVSASSRPGSLPTRAMVSNIPRSSGSRAAIRIRSTISGPKAVRRTTSRRARTARRESIMMFPTLRGGNTNPGAREYLLGEVDDVLAAAEHLARLPYVDPQRIYLGGHSTGGTLALLDGRIERALRRGVRVRGGHGRHALSIIDRSADLRAARRATSGGCARRSTGSRASCRRSISSRARSRPAICEISTRCASRANPSCTASRCPAPITSACWMRCRRRSPRGLSSACAEGEPLVRQQEFPR